MNNKYDQIARFNKPIEESIVSNGKDVLATNSTSTLLQAKNQTNALAVRLINSYKL